MNINIKRGLAIAAVAPFALIGLAGSAGAVVVDPDNLTILGGDIAQAECSHPQGSLDLDFQVRIGVDDSADTDYDVNWVRVRASDDDGSGDYENEDAHVRKVKVSLLRNFSTVASVTRSDHDFKSDGIRSLKINKNNINQARIQVWWSKAGYEGDPYTVACVINASDF